MRIPAALALSFVVLPLETSSAQQPSAQPPASSKWKLALEWLNGEAKTFATDLNRAHIALEARATRENTDLLARLSPEPPATIPRGYGLLPQILEDLPPAPVRLAVTRYSLEKLTTDFMIDRRNAGLLAGRSSMPAESLNEMISELEHARRRLTFMEAQIGYHRHWQQSVLDYPAFFARQNLLLSEAVQLHELVSTAGKADAASQLRRELVDKVAPFQRSSRLGIEKTGTGLVLAVRIATDIEDEAFLAHFERAVEREFNHSSAARTAGLRIALTTQRLTPRELYPEGPPALATPIDSADHLSRFPKDTFVVTSGANSTHAIIGESLQFGTDPMRPRELAHEFGHLLGFKDAYLRAHEGSVTDYFGVVLVEWSGLQDDLMGSSTRGAVTSAMIAQLIATYR